MKFNIWFFLGQCTIFFSQYELIIAKAIIGHNIRQAQSGEFSYITSIMIIQAGHPHSGGSHFCTGIIITRKDVLTAAHCVENIILNTIQMIIGSIDLRNGQIFHPGWWITFNQWSLIHNITNDFDMNDLANIRLFEEVANNIIPVRVSSLSNSELYGANVIIAGWGTNNVGITPNIMEIGNLQIIENHVCEQKLERLVGIQVPISSRILCSFTSPFVLIERGDSGGPILFRNRLIAINLATCPLDQDPPIYDRQINLHLSMHFYRNFIGFMKNA